MAKLRLLFVKEDRAAYISHLDLLRTFQRAFLRLGLVLRHSQGFHPHPILSFALPLPVGQCSDCELLDFETVEDLDAAALPAGLNPFLPQGIRVRACYAPVWPVRDLARLSCRAAFHYDRGVPENGASEIQALLTGPSLVIQKRTKRKSMADVDIRPMLHDLTVSEEPGLLRLDVVVSAQNPGLNPALLGQAVGTYLPALSPDFVTVRRLELLDEGGGCFR